MTSRIDDDNPTYEVSLPDLPGVPDTAQMFVTINTHDGTPFEVFIRFDAPEPFEWVAILATMVTRLLRAGQSLEVIGKEFMEIHGPGTGRYIPGTGEWSPSLVARIGKVFVDYEKSKNSK